MEWSFLRRREGETVIDGRMDVIKYVESSVEMALRWFVDIRQQEGMGWSEVRASDLSKPAN